MISLKTHNILDYVIGAVLVLCPYVFGFASINIARTVFLTLGFGLIGYSLLTNYRYSVLKLIPVSTHMGMDSLLGIVLILAPWLFGYRALVTGGIVALHVLLGLGAIALVMFTDRTTRATTIDRKDTDLRRVA